MQLINEDSRSIYIKEHSDLMERQDNLSFYKTIELMALRLLITKKFEAKPMIRSL